MLSYLIKKKFLQKIAYMYNKWHFVVCVCVCVCINKVFAHLTVLYNNVEEQAEWEEERCHGRDLGHYWNSPSLRSLMLTPWDNCMQGVVSFWELITRNNLYESTSEAPK